ncbi:hypothetical protein BS17DRAFT_469268 [Gyrodon lividus]|nr:hypothetical protein BS17DRAFT_469268 [Gyrodon lividus]
MAAVDGTWGAGLIGLIVACILYGLTNVQTYFYYSTYTNDSLILKSLVALLWALDSAHTAIISHSIYFYVITGYGKPTVTIIWSLPTEVFITATIAFIVQCFLMYRVWKMSGTSLRWVLTIPTLVLSAFSLATGYAYGAKLVEIKVLTRVPEIVSLINMALGSTVAVDVLITLFLSLTLYFNKTGITRSDSVINRLIVYTVNNGLLTSLCALLDVIVHSALPTTFAFLAFYFLLSKLYSNTFLSTLNARRSLRGRGEAPSGTALTLSFRTQSNAQAMSRVAKVSFSAPGQTMFDPTSSELGVGKLDV